MRELVTVPFLPHITCLERMVFFAGWDGLMIEMKGHERWMSMMSKNV